MIEVEEYCDPEENPRVNWDELIYDIETVDQLNQFLANGNRNIKMVDNNIWANLVMEFLTIGKFN